MRISDGYNYFVKNEPVFGLFVFLNILFISVTLYGGYNERTSVMVGIISIAGVLLSKYLNVGAGVRESITIFVEKYAIKLLIIWMVIYLTWSGLVLFSNPYRYEINQGDASLVTQTLWNLLHGFRPENSLYTLNGPVMLGEDPRIPPAYGYISVFNLTQHWLPLTLLTPLYAIFPYPPMHVFALQICIIFIGLPGMYWAVRKAGGTTVFALFMAIGYSVLPHVGTELFFKAYMGFMGLAILPWLFGAILARNWKLVYLFALLTSLTSFPLTQFVIITGLTILIFYRAIVPGIVVMTLGLIIMKVDQSIITSIYSSYVESANEIPSMFKHYVLDKTIGSFRGIVTFNIWYILSLLQSVAFLPILALRQNGRWNMSIIAFFFMLGLVFVATLFRQYGWEFQRNSFFIVPVYIMAAMSYLTLKQQELNQEKKSEKVKNVPSILLMFGLIATIFSGNPNNYPSAIASHFPWGKGVQITADAETKKWKNTIEKFNEIVPEDASIAWRSSPEIQALLTNRQHSWWIGKSPIGVKYYTFIGQADSKKEAIQWVSLIAKFKVNKNIKIIYSGNPGKRLLIMENINPEPIPRNESLLGWTFLSPSRIISQLLND